MLIDIKFFFILQHFCHLIFTEFNNFSFSFSFFSGVLDGDDWDVLSAK